MIKDIDIPKSTNIAIAVTQSEDFYEIYIVNKNPASVSDVMLVIDASNGDKKTSTIRRHIPILAASTAIKLENMLPEVLTFKSIYRISYFLGNKLFDLKIEMENPDFRNANHISEINAEGILIC